VAAGAVLCAGCAVIAVKGFTNACHKDEKGIAEGVIYREDEEGKQRRKELIASLIKVELRRL
jgi:hypothetical protein